MENDITDKSKMVVENVESILENMKEPSVAECTEVTTLTPDPVLESAKALLDSMSESTAAIANMLKPVPSPIKYGVSASGTPMVPKRYLQKSPKRPSGTKVCGSAKWRPDIEGTFKSPDVAMKTTIASNELTLTLEPVPVANEKGFKKVPYYAQSRPKVLLPKPTNLTTTASSETGSNIAMRKFQDWQRKHLNKLSDVNKNYGASSKLKAFAGMNQAKSLNNLNKPQLHPVKQERGTFTANCNNENTKLGQKRKFHDVSDRYYLYLNKPKRARHEPFQVIYRSHILIDPPPTKPIQNTLYPKIFVPWPSGKVIMPGYSPKRCIRKNKAQGGKKKRTYTEYRIPKPKPDPPPVFHNQKTGSKNHQQLSGIKRLIGGKFVIGDKYKWDPVLKKYIAMSGTHKTTKATSAKQWFRFPSSTSLKNGTLQNNSLSIATHTINSLKRKYAAVGNKLKPTRPIPQRYDQSKTFTTPIKIQQSVRDIHVIFNCKIMPDPVLFKRYDYYSDTCLLFQVRRFMSARAQRHGYIEPKDSEITEKSEVALKEKKTKDQVRAACSSVLLSAQTETLFASWSSCLGKLKSLDCKNDKEVSEKGGSKDLSENWLFVCRGEYVELPPMKLPEQSCDVPEEVLKAWYMETSYKLYSNVKQAHNGEDSPSSQTTKPDISGEIIVGKSVVDCGNRVDCNGESPLNERRLLRKQRPLRRVKRKDYYNVVMQKDKRCMIRPSYCVRYRLDFCSLDCSCVGRMPESLYCCCIKGRTSYPNGFYDAQDRREHSKDFLADKRRVANSRKRVQELGTSQPELSSMPGQTGTQSGSDVVMTGASRQDPDRTKHAKLTSLDDSGELIHTNGHGVKPSESYSDPDSTVRNSIHKVELSDIRGKLNNQPHATGRVGELACNGGSKSLAKSEVAVEELASHVPHDFAMPSIHVSAEDSIFPSLIDGTSYDDGVNRNLQAGGRSDPSLTEFENKMKQKLEWKLRESEKQLHPSGHRPPQLPSFTDRFGAEEFAGKAGTGSSISKVIGQRSVDVESGSADRRSRVKAIERENDAKSRSKFDDSGRDSAGSRVAEGETFRGLSRFSCEEAGEYSNSPVEKKYSGVGNALYKEKTGDTASDTGAKRLAKESKDRIDRSNLIRSRDIYEFQEEEDISVNMKLKISNDVNIVDEAVDDCYLESKAGTCLRSYANDPSAPAAKLLKLNSVEGKITTAKLRNGQLRSSVASRVGQNGLRKHRHSEQNDRPRSENMLQEDSAPKTFQKRNEKRSNSQNESAARNNCESACARPNEKTQRSQIHEGKTPPAFAATDRNECAHNETSQPVETRSSKRLRSRVNCSKRGRYESDYVSDLPKIIKKPKKVLPTNEYDNEDFWQFYKICESTVYAKNLLLQHKYIKLLKSKGITSPCSDSDVQYSNIACATSTIPLEHEAPVVPDNGLMPFLEKYTKQRKTLPEMPKAPDDHCAYCGRSFVGRERKEYEDHVARHGMRYTILSTPHLPKKKKKWKPMRKETKRAEAKPPNSANVVGGVGRPVRDDKSSFANKPGQSLDELRPLPRPSLLSMGHRKQTARKSFSLAATLPKDMLIAALECEMRAQSNITCKSTETGISHSKQILTNNNFSRSPGKMSTNNNILVNDFLPKPNSARKTLTGLPITYNHLHRTYM